jgi:hypothetical protein
MEIQRSSDPVSIYAPSRICFHHRQTTAESLITLGKRKMNFQHNYQVPKKNSYTSSAPSRLRPPNDRNRQQPSPKLQSKAHTTYSHSAPSVEQRPKPVYPDPKNSSCRQKPSNRQSDHLSPSIQQPESRWRRMRKFAQDRKGRLVHSWSFRALHTGAEPGGPPFVFRLSTGFQKCSRPNM